MILLTTAGVLTDLPTPSSLTDQAWNLRHLDGKLYRKKMVA